MQIVEGAYLGFPQPSTLRGIRVDIVEVGKILRVFKLAKIGVRMAGFTGECRGDQQGTQEYQDIEILQILQFILIGSFIVVLPYVPGPVI